MSEFRETVIHAGEVRTRVVPMPGEIWLHDSHAAPCIITKITRGRVSWVEPTTGGDGDGGPPYRESYCGSEFFFEEEWTQIWPVGRRRLP